MAYLGLARKYRPQKFSELVGQEIVIKILQNALKTGKVPQAYVFSGPKGVGKTSTARILAKALNCEISSDEKPCDMCPSCVSIREGRAMSVIEIDAASHTSVENIRDIREKVRYASAEGIYKVYIIDEAHMLSQSAFNAFLKTLEEPPEHVVFVLATTEPRKIPLTVISRCQHLQFKRIPVQVIKERLLYICKQEGIEASEEALYLIASSVEGSMRDALMLLDQVTSFTDKITVDDIKLLIGGTDIGVLEKLTDALIEGNRELIIEQIQELNDIGTDFKMLTKDLIYFLRNIITGKITGNYSIIAGEAESKIIKNLGDKTSEGHLILLLKEMINSEGLIKSSFFPRIIFEITMLKLSYLAHFKNIDATIPQIKDKKPLSEPITQEKKSNDVNKSYNKDKNISELWSDFLIRVEENNHILASKIKHAEVKFQDKEIMLIYNGGASLYAESVRNALDEIHEILKEFFSDVKITIHEKKKIEKRNLKEEALNNPVVKKALQLFDGRILNITYNKEENNV